MADMRKRSELLLVEDNVDDRALFAKAVATSELPVTITYAANASEAVMRLNQIGPFAGIPLPALIVLDLSLPGLKGQTLLQVIRNAFGPQLIPIVILTGSLAERDRLACERWGISGYAVKPQTQFGLVQFVSGLARFLEPGTWSGGIPTIDGERRPTEADIETPRPG